MYQMHLMEATPASAPSAASPTKRSRPSAESDQEDGDYPYEVDATDHCETPGAAYDHVAPLLRMLAALSGRTPATLRIYDPYYCEGGVVGRLGELGFHRVYNEREDFYEAIERDRIPVHDVVVTNPPYSGDHIGRVIEFCRRNGKPWMLLLPNFCYLKDYFREHAAPQRPFFIVPPTRYQYLTVKGRHQKKSATVTSPFFSFWYLWAGPHTERVVAAWRSAFEADRVFKPESGLPMLARTPAQLPVRAMDSNDPQLQQVRSVRKRRRQE